MTAIEVLVKMIGGCSVAIKMVVIGANPANAEELKTVVSATVGPQKSLMQRSKTIDRSRMPIFMYV